MCGIFALLNYFTVYNNDTIEREFMKGKKQSIESYDSFLEEDN